MSDSGARDSKGLDQLAKPSKPGTTRTARGKAGAKLKTTGTEAGKIEDAVVVGQTAADEDKVSETEQPQAVVADDTGAPLASDVDASEPTMSDGGDTLAGDEASVGEPADLNVEASDGAAVDAPGEETSKTQEQPTPPYSAVAVAPALPEPPKRGGFVPMVLGGVIAALLGAAALYYGNREGWIDLGSGNSSELQASLDAQASQIDTLSAALESARAEITELRAVKPDLSPATDAAAKVAADLVALRDETASLSAQIEANDARLAEVETQPIPKAELPAEVVAAYEAKLGELNSALDQRFVAMQTAQDAKLTAIEGRLDAQLAEIEAAQSAASAAELAAMESAKVAGARAALAEIDMALDTGAGFAEALTALEASGAAVPPAPLTELAGSGAPTLMQLQATFPAAARAALVASTRAGAADGSVDRMTAFLRTQLGARSLEPREGDDPDAVLSRAEDAVSRGDLTAALDEIAALPEPGQAALADWKAQAETLIAAKAALGGLSDQLNTN